MKKEITTNANPLTTLLRNYESASVGNISGSPEREKEYTDALTKLATACTFSVLKKLINVGGIVTEDKKVISDSAKVIRELRQALVKDLQNLNRLTYAVENATALERNQDGDLERVIRDKGLHEASKKLASETLSDGFDLINTAVKTILKETSKTDLSPLFMETPYEVRRLKRKVYIKDKSSLGGYETVETTPIQEVFKAIRRDIQNNRTIQIAGSKYTYIADTLKDTESDVEEAVFRRLPKYSGLAYASEPKCDIYGNSERLTSTTAITADNESVVRTDNILERLNLTKKQATIIQLRLSGYGFKAIATYLGVSKNTVFTTLKRIQDKCVALGFAPIE